MYCRTLELHVHGLVWKTSLTIFLGNHTAQHHMTIGQYLQPAASNVEVKEYVTPEVFDEYRRIGLEKGFTHVESGPLVRSSYHAEKHVR